MRAPLPLAALALLFTVDQAVAETADAACRALWTQVTTLAGAEGETGLTGQRQPAREGWCTVTRTVLDLPGTYQPDIHIDRLAVRGPVQDWLGGAAAPSGVLELKAEGLRLVGRTGDGALDYMLKAQTLRAASDVLLTLRWDADTRLIHVESLSVDFPGENDLALSATLAGAAGPQSLVSAPGAMGLSVTEAQLAVTSHGLFETWLLPVLVSALPPGEADAEAAAEALRAQALTTLEQLPDASFPRPTREALAALVRELPNPEGRLTLHFTADPGFGAVRFAGFALSGMPQTMAEAAPLFQGVRIEAEWTHQDAPD